MKKKKKILRFYFEKIKEKILYIDKILSNIVINFLEKEYQKLLVKATLLEMKQKKG